MDRQAVATFLTREIKIGREEMLDQTKRASEILGALDGLSISEARKLLNTCSMAIECETVRWVRDSTA